MTPLRSLSAVSSAALAFPQVVARRAPITRFIPDRVARRVVARPTAAGSGTAGTPCEARCR